MENSKPIKEKKPQKVNKKRLYKFAVFVFKGIIKLFFFADIKGVENMPKDGSCFVCCNHISNWDPILLVTAIKRPISFMAKKQLFRIPILKNLLHAFGAFSVDRDNTDITAIKTALTLIKHGESVGIFPQGRRLAGIKPETENIKSGTGMLVFKTECDVIPVSVYTNNYEVRLFRKVYINIGSPIKFSEYDVHCKGTAEYQHISDIIFERICMLNEESRIRAEKR